MPFQIGRHVHPKAHADAPPPQAPTGIDYLRLIQDRHSRALGERLQYAHLSEPAEPAEPASEASSGQPPADDNGLGYDTDLLALAGIEDRTDRPSMVAPNPGLEAERDGVTSLPAHTDSTDQPATDDLEETQ